MRYASIFLFVFLTFLATVVGVNYLFGFRVSQINGVSPEKWAAKELLSKNWVEGNRDVDRRALKLYLIEGETKAPDIVVLGSSRSMQIGNWLFPNKTVANYSVDSGHLEDHISLLQALRRKKILPKRLLLGIDQWILLDMPLSTSRELSADFLAGLKELGRQTDDFQLWSRWQFDDFISVNRFIDVLWSFRPRTCSFLVAGPRRQTDCFVYKGLDYSVAYPKAFREKSPHSVRTELELVVSRRGRLYGFNNATQVGYERKKLFSDFIAYISQLGIEIAIFMPPFHPFVVDAYRNRLDWKLLQETEAFIQKVAAKHRVPVFGEGDSASVGCTEEEFFDAIHPRKSCLQRIFDSLSRRG
jgi:hypothetical protein